MALCEKHQQDSALLLRLRGAVGVIPNGPRLEVKPREKRP
jgi:hypothetical protein